MFIVDSADKHLKQIIYGYGRSLVTRIKSAQIFTSRIVEKVIHIYFSLFKHSACSHSATLISPHKCSELYYKKCGTNPSSNLSFI
jgi:hypothetical protein